jgi:N-acetylneuraminic acid mutarotase
MRIFINALFLCLFNSVSAQIDTITWAQLSPLPDSIQRIGCGYFLIDSNFYVVGGLANNSYPINTVWKYHIPTDNWVQMKNLPFGPAETGGYFVLNGNAYFLTAYDSITNGNCDTTFWEYDPSGDNWIRKANFPDKPRQNSSSFSYNGMGYVGFTEGCITDDNHLWQYDPILDKWTQMTALPAAIAAGRAVTTALPAAAYFIAGTYPFGTFINDVWRYNIDSNSWDSIGQMSGLARWTPVFWSFDSILIGGGGEDGINSLNDFYSYNISTNIWNPVVFLNSFDSSAGGGTFIFDKTGYYFGGYSRVAPSYIISNKMWSFDASRFFPDTTTGIVQVKNQVNFSVYPNPASHGSGFYISTSESGSVLFYDALGRTLDERKLVHGLNQIKLSTNDEVIFYRATMLDGSIDNGKIVFVK